MTARRLAGTMLICLGSVLLATSLAWADGAADSQDSPYSTDQRHDWNRLHRALFVRTDAKGRRHVHALDPLLFRGGKFLLKATSHHRAVAALDRFLAAPPEFSDQPLKRLYLQRDLWSTFDYVGWYPDEWVFRSKYEPAAKALRKRLASSIGRLALSPRQLDGLADNYAAAIQSGDYPPAYDVRQPGRPFLPPDLFAAAGPWVRFHHRDREPMAKRHFDGAGGRAVHIVFLRLPGGRAATERYLAGLGAASVNQFPVGTMVAMVRRAVTIDDRHKLRLTPITELVQIRVYRRIPDDPRAYARGDFGEQDVYEFLLDRGRLYAGGHGLLAVGADAPERSFRRREGDPFALQEKDGPSRRSRLSQLKGCIQCHQKPGVHSVISLRRGLQMPDDENFSTYSWRVETGYSLRAKVNRFDWGLLQGMLEAGQR